MGPRRPQNQVSSFSWRRRRTIGGAPPVEETCWPAPALRQSLATAALRYFVPEVAAGDGHSGRREINGRQLGPPPPPLTCCSALGFNFLVASVRRGRVCLFCTAAAGRIPSFWRRTRPAAFAAVVVSVRHLAPASATRRGPSSVPLPGRSDGQMPMRASTIPSETTFNWIAPASHFDLSLRWPRRRRRLVSVARLACILAPNIGRLLERARRPDSDDGD
jgi:hypothetical protein